MTCKPPVRCGVSASCVALPTGSWPSLLAFLQARFAHVEPQVWLDRLARGMLFDEQGAAISLERACCQSYQGGTRLYYYREVAAELPIALEEERIVYEDVHLLVADKPHFLPVTPSGHYLQQTLLVRLKRKLGLDDLTPVHRIDRDTAGLVLFCKQHRSRAAFAALFSQQRARKTYHAIAAWRP